MRRMRVDALRLRLTRPPTRRFIRDTMPAAKMDKQENRVYRGWLIVAMALMLAACSDIPQPATAQPLPEKAAPVVAPSPAGQRGQGSPYEVIGSEVWDVPDPLSGRNYQVFVALPPSYAKDPERRYPVLYVTDADYAFPIVRQIARRLNLDRPQIDEFILVGLSYAVGEAGMSSRRDYTPTAAGSHDSGPDAVHGQGKAYQTYLRDQVFPFVAQRYRAGQGERLFLGHSYGALLGAHILLTEPAMFSGYLLGSPSLWYDQHVLEKIERAYAASHQDLTASVYVFVGEYEDMKPGDPRFAKRYNMVSDARRLEQSLNSRRYPSLRIKLDVLNDEDHLSVAPRGFTHGLKYLLGQPAAGPSRSE